MYNNEYPLPFVADADEITKVSQFLYILNCFHILSARPTDIVPVEVVRRIFVNMRCLSALTTYSTKSATIHQNQQ